MSKDKTNLIAVYGTLRRGCGNNAYFLGQATYKGTFTTEPVYSMFSLGGFPGLKNDGNTSIVMEVYEVDEKEAANVDALEGYTEGVEATFYDKQPIETPWGEAGVYIYVRPAEHLQKVESGDWLNRDVKIVTDGVDN